jgi:hypothetical protein
MNKKILVGVLLIWFILASGLALEIHYQINSVGLIVWFPFSLIWGAFILDKCKNHKTLPKDVEDILLKTAAFLEFQSWESSAVTKNLTKQVENTCKRYNIFK